MTRPKTVIAILFCALCITGIVAAADTNETVTASESAPCCFENPRFSGTCQVNPGPEESCGSILGYLNNPNSVGKAYCGNTRVRGGWSTVSCEGAAVTVATKNRSENRE
jgi:hypothetical protein